MSIQRNALIVAATAFAYFLLFRLNALLFSSLEYSAGVHWIFLPSGLRLVFVLLFGPWGAIGIALATVINDYLYQFGGDLTALAGAGVIAGVAPWLAGLICADLLELDVELENLTGATLLKVALLFALISPVLHQLWFTLSGLTENFINSTTVMFTGDLLGSLAVLYAAKFMLTLVPQSGNYQDP